VVQKDLLTFAHVVRARMKVLSDGELVYEIPAGYKGTLLQRSISFRVFTIGTILWPYVFSAVKCAFGVMLFASLAVSAAVISASLTSSSERSEMEQNKQEKEGKRRLHRGRSEYGTAGVAVDLTDLAWFASRCAGRGTRASEDGSPSRNQSVPGLGFLESFFSFVFGDGDPNAGQFCGRVLL